MSKKSKSKSSTKSVPRNSSALAAKSRKAGMAPMKSRNTPRGGQKNEQRGLLEQAEEEKVDTDKIADALGAEYLGTIESRSGYFDALGVAAEKTGFDNWLDRQMQNPEFKRVYDEMVEHIKKGDEKNEDD
jgi:hypothetical protein